MCEENCWRPSRNLTSKLLNVSKLPKKTQNLIRKYEIGFQLKVFSISFVKNSTWRYSGKCVKNQYSTASCPRSAHASPFGNFSNFRPVADPAWGPLAAVRPQVDSINKTSPLLFANFPEHMDATCHSARFKIVDMEHPPTDALMRYNTHVLSPGQLTSGWVI